MSKISIEVMPTFIRIVEREISMLTNRDFSLSLAEEVSEAIKDFQKFKESILNGGEKNENHN